MVATKRTIKPNVCGRCPAFLWMLGAPLPGKKGSKTGFSTFLQGFCNTIVIIVSYGFQSNKNFKDEKNRWVLPLTLPLTTLTPE